MDKWDRFDRFSDNLSTRPAMLVILRPAPSDVPATMRFKRALKTLDRHFALVNVYAIPCPADPTPAQRRAIADAVKPLEADAADALASLPSSSHGSSVITEGNAA